MILTLHIFAAVWALVTGTVQLASRKGTSQHKLMGWSWMIAMVITAVSSFWLRGFEPLIGPFSIIHLLSFWVLICVAASIYFARIGKINRHKGFAKGAYFGLIGTGIGTLAPGRFIHEWLFSFF